jgi:hypothetical protein
MSAPLHLQDLRIDFHLRLKPWDERCLTLPVKTSGLRGLLPVGPVSWQISWRENLFSDFFSRIRYRLLGSWLRLRFLVICFHFSRLTSESSSGSLSAPERRREVQ